MNIAKTFISTFLLFAAVAGIGGGILKWKHFSTQKANATASKPNEPIESITVAAAKRFEHRPTTTMIGTIVALRSITLKNELPGTVRQVILPAGKVVEEGSLLIRMDVSVEEAELKAHQAHAALAETTYKRKQQALLNLAVPEIEVVSARAERDIALAQIARIKAVIDRKTIRAPFRARVGLANVHPGQYLNEGTLITTLQGIADATHVDFSVPQQIAEGLSVGQRLRIFATDGCPLATARIIALDASINTTTRNSMVRARIKGPDSLPPPGSSVLVKVPAGPARKAVSVPANALRQGPDGEYVFVVVPDKNGLSRARLRRVKSGALLGNEVAIYDGLNAGELIAASGAFKLRERVLVAIADDTAAVSSKRNNTGD